MDDPATSRIVFLGHLLITVPAILVIPLVLYCGLYMFGPGLLLYYACAGLATSWQWCSMAIPRWQESLRDKNVPANEVEEIQRRTGVLWAGASTIGPFAFHTTIVAVCAIRVGPWLIGRWFEWMLPLSGRTSPSGFTAYSDYYLQHLQLVSILPALVVGYVVCRYVPRLATWAWILPTIILLYKLLTFTDPQTSVFISHHFSSFSYYFVIVRLAPTFTDLRGSDPIRVVQQMMVVAPFYSGVAYSIGALLENHRILERFISSIFAEPEPEVFGAEDSVADVSETPLHDGNQIS
jgi:hypothetical protein